MGGGEKRDRGAFGFSNMGFVAVNAVLLSRLLYERGVRYDCSEMHSGGLFFEGEGKECKNEGVHLNTSPSKPPALTSDTHKSSVPSDTVINFDHGDPTLFIPFWRRTGESSTIVIKGWQSMSYFSDIKSVCWFLEPGLADSILQLHHLVGNAETEGRHIVVGTGSSQLFLAAVYALAPRDTKEPISVVGAAPFYSSYQAASDYLRSEVFRWAGDAYAFERERVGGEERPYIELVTSPNNPDGFTREAVVNGSMGKIIYDFAYYWPHYTPITSPADKDIMLFTVSKSTGHAGTRIGWALVKDLEVAKRMTMFIVLNTIGVSKDSQLRAANILRTVISSYERKGGIIMGRGAYENFFKHGHELMSKRWERLRQAVDIHKRFSLPEFPSAFCNFLGRPSSTQPAFAWTKCEGDEIEDCEAFLKSHNILTRGGRSFGWDPKYVRISLLDTDSNFDIFINRISNIN
ncbi:hypothetical protein AMTR_s00011p00049200 [Amborella trichopoda]|uniref:Alliinase C-terminal domain-containing protein n=1 Tax=Amborella trichopoda TaxID=13333 RepID=W1NGG5_AMBTC|nr:hypothetical protein AMTR_s00011p00049200 [Amborella trichopoda]